MQILSPLDAVSPAFARTKLILFSPFRKGRSWKLAATAYLATAGTMFFPFMLVYLAFLPMARKAGGAVAFWGVIAAILFLTLLYLVLFYVCSRLRFAFFDIVLNRGEFVAPAWRKYGPQSFKWTLFKVALGTLTLAVFAVPVASVGRSFFILLSSVNTPEYKTISRPLDQRWTEALHNFKDQPVNVVFICDSYCVANTINSNSAIFIGPGYRMVDQVRTDLQAAGYTVRGNGFSWVVEGDDCIAVDQNFWSSSVAFGAAGSRCTSPIGPSGESANGGFYKMSSGEVLTYATSSPFDTAHLLCATLGSAAAIAVKVDGATVGTCGASSSAGTGETINAVTGGVFHLLDSSAVSLGTHALTFTCASGPCYAGAADVTAGSNGIDIHNMGIGGTSSGEFSRNVTVQSGWLPLLHPQLIVYGHLTNEPGNGVSTATYTSDINNLVSYVRGSTFPDPPSILMYTPIACGIAGTDPYVPIQQAAALANNTGYFSMRNTSGPYSSGSLVNTDICFNGHPNQKFQGTAAAMLLSAMVDSPLSGLPPAPAVASSSSLKLGEQPPPDFFVSMIAFEATFFLVYLGIALVFFLSSILSDFIVPSLALEDTTLTVAFKRLLQLLRNEPGQIALYAVLKLGLGAALYFGAVIAFEIVFFVAIAIVGGIAFVLGYLLYLAHLPIAILIVLGVLIGLAFYAALMYGAMLIVGAVMTFLESYTLYFLGGRYPMLGNLLELSTPPPSIYAPPTTYPPYVPPPPGV